MATNTLSWYALNVKPRHEKVVSAALRGKGLADFLPLYERQHHSAGRVRTSHVPLFPTYVFCRMDPLLRLPILAIPGVRSFVSAGNRPTPVDEREIAALTSLVQSGFPLEPEPYIAIGDPVYIQSGPLRGLEGKLIACKGQYRLIVSVTLLQRSVSVEIPRGTARPAIRTTTHPGGGSLGVPVCRKECCAIPDPRLIVRDPMRLSETDEAKP